MIEKDLYKLSGVDIDKGDQLVDKIKSHISISGKHNKIDNIGMFASQFDLSKINVKQPVLFSATDGVGTKLLLAIENNYLDEIGIDLVAMCVNDIATHGAKPLFFLDYFATSHLDLKQAEQVIESIIKGCNIAGCELAGGETAEMPGLYKDNDFDLAGFAVGVAEKNMILPNINNIKTEDLLIGITASGLHANGFSLINKILVDNKVKLNQKISFSQNKILSRYLLTQTKIYCDLIKYLLPFKLINSISHITGGGMTENITRVIPDNLAIEIDCNSYNVPEHFTWIQKLSNIDTKQLYRIFNMGIGLVLIVSPQNLNKITKLLDTKQEKYYIIGSVIEKQNDKENRVDYRNLKISL